MPTTVGTFGASANNNAPQITAKKGSCSQTQQPFFLYYPEQNRGLELLLVLVEFVKECRGREALH